MEKLIEKLEYTVTFYSPGTFVAEDTTKSIPEINIPLAMKMAADIVERHGAVPYAFFFTTYSRPAPIQGHEFKAKKVERSGLYYINGKVETIEDVGKRGDPGERILLSNMRVNEWKRIVTTKKGWRWTQPLNPGDKVLDDEGNVIHEES